MSKEPLYFSIYKLNGEKTGKIDIMGRRIRMSPKDAIRHDPEFGDPLYKHIPFYIKLKDRTVLVKCKKPAKKEFDIIISCERFELIGMGDE